MALNMHHQTQKGFCGILDGILNHQKGYLVYVSHKQKMIYSYNVVFDESFSIALVYTSQTYAESMDMWLSVTNIPYAKSSMEQTINIIKFEQFEEWYLWSETRDNTESR